MFCQQHYIRQSQSSPSAFSIFLIYLFLAISTSLLGQNKLVNSIDQYYLIQDRIATGLVFDILQDKQGFMWFATEYGLIRYDGKNLVNYRSIPRDTNSLAGDVINCLAEGLEDKLWIGTRNSGLHLFNPRTASFSRYQYDPLNPMSLPNNKVNDILPDPMGNIWVATHGEGVRLFNKKNGDFRHPRGKDGKEILPKTGFVNDLLLVDSNQIWIATAKGLEKWDIATKNTIRSVHLPNPKDTHLVFKTLLKDRLGILWAGTQNKGLYQLSETKKKYQAVSLPTENERPNVSHIWRILPDKHKNFWIATDGGLFYLIPQEDDDQSSNYTVSKFTQLPVKRALSLYESRDGVVWIGTNSGVIVLAPRYNPFHHFRAVTEREEQPKTRGIKIIAEDKDGQIWVGTSSGLFQFDPIQMRLHQNFLSQYPELSYFDQSNIIALFSDSRDHIWLSTVVDFNVGFELFQYEKNTRKLTDFTHRWPPFQSYATLDITEDPNGELWFSNGRGLVRYLVSEDSLLIYQHNPEDTKSIASNSINMVAGTQKNALWVATNDAGLNKLDINTDNFFQYPPITSDSTSISSPQVRCIHASPDGHLWLGTAGGLNRFDPVKEIFQSFSTNQGLKENLVKSIIQDGQGNIWLSTPHWLNRFDVKTSTITKYGQNDGIKADEYQARKAFKDAMGRLYFGGNNGLVVFHPDSIRPNPFFPPVAVTDFWLFNKPLPPESKKKILPFSVNFTDRITLKPKENVFTFHFAALSFINPQQNSFAYQLEGFDPDWQRVGNRNEVTYTNLKHGKYNFKVKAANNDGLWNEQEASLQLIILPSWYQTWWSYSLFASLSILTLWLLYRFQLKRQLQLAEHTRLKDLDELKTHFFTNISHEFRTPITIILGLTDHVKNQVSEGVKSSLDMIRRNGHQLLFLVNQLLDLSRLESRQIKLNLQEGDIISFLKQLTASFHSYAESKAVKLHYKTEPDALTMTFDPERLQQVMTNLLSNAIKYTSAKGRVNVGIRKRNDQLEIVIKDSGIGISEKDLPHIFDRFFRSQDTYRHAADGAGLGLALTKELVKLMDGTIEVTSKLGEGTAFTLSLPIHRALSLEQKTTTINISQKQNANFKGPLYGPKPEKVSMELVSDLKNNLKQAGSDSPLVLLIEDNADMVSYLISCLKESFFIEVAYNGQEGLDKAYELIPDIIISDIMMPEKDGIEVSRSLKKDLRTSHIPIILLTAKADTDSRLSGLQLGVEAYLVKPFYRKELLVRIQAILERRKRLQLYYASMAGIPAMPGDEPVADETAHENPFLNQLRSIVEENISNHEFSVPLLCRAIGMSHPQLYRKMKALTGYSAGQYIRTIRILKAKSLLSTQKNWTIAAVAYEVGFADPDYFSKVFKSEVGISPSHFRNR